MSDPERIEPITEKFHTEEKYCYEEICDQCPTVATTIITLLLVSVNNFKLSN